MPSLPPPGSGQGVTVRAGRDGAARRSQSCTDEVSSHGAATTCEDGRRSAHTVGG